MRYDELSESALKEEYAKVKAEFEAVKALGLKLDMSRGKPEATQATLSMDMLSILRDREDLVLENGTDTANYGIMDGIPEAKQLIADVVGARPEQVSVWNNASLEIMFNLVNYGYVHGIGGAEPWCRQSGLKWLCPVPGYDRHFAITEYFGFEMINLPLGPEGPDMDEVEELVKDPSVKGIWCVPLYSNPGGVCYSDGTVRRFAALKPAAPDFRIFWDNAYLVHHLYPENPAKLLNILEEAPEYGNDDLVYEFFSTSKITVAGDGIGALITSETNLAEFRKTVGLMTVGFDKINMLRHVRFLKNAENLRAHMEKHAAILRPKFEAVEETLAAELGSLGIAEWTLPRGGYFISLNVLPGLAKRTVALCREAGVVLTGAGATYPYKNDPEDRNIRIAPTYPSPENLAKACKVLTLCVRLASLEKMIGA